MHAARSSRGVEPPSRIMLKRRTEKDKAIITGLERKIVERRNRLLLALRKSCAAEEYIYAERPSLHHQQRDTLTWQALTFAYYCCFAAVDSLAFEAQSGATAKM